MLSQVCSQNLSGTTLPCFLPPYMGSNGKYLKARHQPGSFRDYDKQIPNLWFGTFGRDRCLRKISTFLELLYTGDSCYSNRVFPNQYVLEGRGLYLLWSQSVSYIQRQISDCVLDFPGKKNFFLQEVHQMQTYTADIQMTFSNYLLWESRKSGRKKKGMKVGKE